MFLDFFVVSDRNLISLREKENWLIYVIEKNVGVVVFKDLIKCC